MNINQFLSRENIRRVRKLEDALHALQAKKQTSFSITKLTSIKSLCKEDFFRKEYCRYLASVVIEDAKLSENNEDDLNKLFHDAQHAITDLTTHTDEGDEAAAERTLSQLIHFQNEHKRVKSYTIRIIKNRNLIILEDILRCLLAYRTDAATAYAYDATRSYVEKYNPRYGTGLNVDSIPMLEKVIQFWKRYEK
jgi:hypothetical protein